MPNYRRNFIRGGTYFFTVTLKDRRKTYLTDHIECLRSAIQRTKKSHPFAINSWVILPDHMHTIWTLPEGDCDFPMRWRAIKTFFCIESGKNNPCLLRKKIWQRGYWEHTIRSEKDFIMHMHYVHINPLKHGYVNRVFDWPYSSFHHFVKKGIYSEGWGENIEFDDTIKFGE